MGPMVYEITDGLEACFDDDPENYTHPTNLFTCRTGWTADLVLVMNKFASPSWVTNDHWGAM
jgi:hypothetical protein